MIRATVDFVKWGFGEPEEMSVLEIGNDGTGTKALGNYNYKITKKGSEALWKSGRVEGFPRKRLGHWDLIFRCLKDAIGERNDKN